MKTKQLAIIIALFITLLSLSTNTNAQTNSPPSNQSPSTNTNNQSTPQEKISREKPANETGFEKSQEGPAPEKNPYEYPYNKKKEFEEFLKIRNSKQVV